MPVETLRSGASASQDVIRGGFLQRHGAQREQSCLSDPARQCQGQRPPWVKVARLYVVTRGYRCEAARWLTWPGCTTCTADGVCVCSGVFSGAFTHYHT